MTYFLCPVNAADSFAASFFRGLLQRIVANKHFCSETEFNVFINIFRGEVTTVSNNYLRHSNEAVKMLARDCIKMAMCTRVGKNVYLLPLWYIYIYIYI